MRLSAKTKYGVRAVYDIAYHSQHDPSLAIQAKDIAQREQIPLRYLEQIFQDLRRAGIIESKRGPRGGYLLKRRPEDLTLAEVVAVLQGPISELFSGDESEVEGEPPTSHLVTSQLWDELGAMLTEWFDKITLAELIKRGNALDLARNTGESMYFI